MGFRKICLLSVLVLSMILLVGCLSKTALSAESFKSQMESMGYSVSDATAVVNSSMVKSVYVASSKDGSYQIEFFEQNSAADAIESFNTNVSTMESSKSGVSSSTSFTGMNYDKQTLTSNGEYWVVSRVENTFIFAHVSQEYKDDVKAAIDSLGY